MSLESLPARQYRSTGELICPYPNYVIVKSKFLRQTLASANPTFNNFLNSDANEYFIWIIEEQNIQSNMYVYSNIIDMMCNKHTYHDYR